jgi:CRP-like cAMP-binding protein
MVFVALQHDSARRSNSHLETIERYLRGVPGLVFAVAMPKSCLRQLCVAAELRRVPRGEALFTEATPADSLNVVVSGRARVRRRVSGVGAEAATEEEELRGGEEEGEVLSMGQAADADDFFRVSSASTGTGATGGGGGGVPCLLRRKSAWAHEGDVLVLTIERDAFEAAVRSQVAIELEHRLAAIESAGGGLFQMLPRKLRLILAECLRPGCFRRGEALTTQGASADRMFFLREGEGEGEGRARAGRGGGGRGGAVPQCKVVARWSRSEGARVAGWGARASVRELEVFSLAAGDTCGEEALLNR